MRDENLHVLKFGGSSLATPELIRSVAKNISELQRAGKKLIVVVSAMGGTTDELHALAKKVSPRPNRRELDMLISTGERVTMALMSMALHDFNCPSISFTGSQAGVMTDSSHSNARIIELKPKRVAQALEEDKVVVLAGFQGVDPLTKEITTLGRGGSDTTAVAMAAHFNAGRCEFYKDVDGVYSADPKLVKRARLYSELPITVLHDMCFWGAKVLNYRAVEWAREKRVPLFIGRSETFKIGTTLVDYNTSSPKLVGVNSHPFIIELISSEEYFSQAAHAVAAFADMLGLPPPQLLRAEQKDGKLFLLITSDKDTLDEIVSNIAKSGTLQLSQKDISSVTETFSNEQNVVHVVPWADREPLVKTLHLKIEDEP